jgi:TolB-like protein/DNA-binding winged helix-turn-helix (wHTH) protein
MLREPDPGLVAEQRLALKGFILDLARGELLDAQGRPAGLRAQALKLLLVLGEHAGQVVGKEELQRRVWGDVIVTEDSIVQAIGDIRRVLGDDRHTLLRTVPRRGYLLDAVPAAGPKTPTDIGPELPAEVGAARARHRRAWTAALGALAVVLAIGVASLLPREAAVPQRSLAIMPFESDDPAAADAWFVDAITADVHTIVARWRTGLKMIGRGTMQRYKGQIADPRAVGNELGVAHVLTGRVRREGERVRIAVEVVETAGGRVVWTQPFDIHRAELPGSIGDIAGGIAKALSIELGDIVTDHGRRLDAAQADAEDLAMRGFSVHLKGISPDNFAQARQYFEQAVARDPRSMRGLAGLSITHSMDVAFTWAKDPAESMRHSKEALERIEAIDPHAHLTLLARGRRLGRAVREFGRARAQLPERPDLVPPPLLVAASPGPLRRGDPGVRARDPHQLERVAHADLERADRHERVHARQLQGGGRARKDPGDGQHERAVLRAARRGGTAPRRPARRCAACVRRVPPAQSDVERSAHRARLADRRRRRGVQRRPEVQGRAGADHHDGAPVGAAVTA